MIIALSANLFRLRMVLIILIVRLSYKVSQIVTAKWELVFAKLFKNILIIDVRLWQGCPSAEVILASSVSLFEGKKWV